MINNTQKTQKMKTYIVLAMMLLLGFSGIAQKKEIKQALKELKKDNFDAASTALDAAELLSSSMDTKMTSQYNFLRSKTYFRNGESDLDNIIKAIDALEASNGYEGTEQQQQLILAHLVNKGSELLGNQDYPKASNYFRNAYRLPPNDAIYLYYAASTSVNGGLYDEALAMYEELKALKYTGVVEQFFAVNNDTQKEDLFDTKTMRDISVKAKTHSNPTSKLTKSKYPEIIKNMALIYVQQGDNDKALASMTEARAQNPEDLNLLLTEANVHYSMGNMDQFKSLLEIATQRDPNNAELQYNLGVIAAEAKDFDNSKKYYQRAIEIDPNYTNALINLAALILGQEEGILEEMNGLGSSAADDRRYDQLKEERNQLYLDAIPYLEKALTSDPKNYQAAKTLSNIFSAVGDTDKYKEYKAMADRLETQQ